MRLFAFVLALLGCAAAHAATSFALETPRSISVAGGESALIAVKFFNAAGQPAAGETVQFTNDGCGFFPNGAFVYNTQVGADGRALATFTASNPPGITCWIYANAGARAVVDVLTYRASEVQVVATADAIEKRPGKPYSVRVRPAYGGYSLKQVDLDARVVSGAATVSPLRASTGDAGTVDFEITPGASLAGSVIEFAYRGQKTSFTVLPPTAPWQDLWWVGKSEDGWGMSIVQHRDQLFSVIYAYDAAGKPTWFVIPGGSWNPSRTEFTGEVYVPTGSPFYAYDTSKFLVGPPVGSVRFTVDGLSRIALDYTILGKTGHKDLVRNDFGPIDITVQPGAGDMWWGGAAQNGWGVAVLQQYKTLFLVWFTYDATGAPTWFVMPGGSWVTLDTYSGRVYRASSMQWLGTTYEPSLFHTTDVGSYSIKFNGSDAAVLTYAIEGRTGSIPLTRTPF